MSNQLAPNQRPFLFGSLLLAWWILDERLEAVQIAGTALILFGVVLTQRMASRSA